MRPDPDGTRGSVARSCGVSREPVLGLLLVLVAILTGLLLLPSVCLADPGALTGVEWWVSNSQTASDGVTYSYSFALGSAVESIAYVSMTVPPGTSGSPVVDQCFGVVAPPGSPVTLADDMLTIAVSPSAAAPDPGVPVYISVAGLTNTEAAGAYSASITVFSDTPPDGEVDTGDSEEVDFGSSSVEQTLHVAQTLVFRNDNPSFSLGLSPLGIEGGSNHSRVNYSLTVQTNAPNGYSLSIYGSPDGLFKSTLPTYTIPGVTSGVSEGVAEFPDNGVGFKGAMTTGGVDAPDFAAGLENGQWVGYPTAVETLLTTAGPTGSGAPDTIQLTNQVAVDFGVPAGTYTQVITFVVTPNY